MTSLLSTSSSPLRPCADSLTGEYARNANLLLSPDGSRPTATEPVVHPAAIPRDREDKKRVFGRSNSVLVDPVIDTTEEDTAEIMKVQKSTGEDYDPEDATSHAKLTWAPMKPSRRFMAYNDSPEHLKDLQDAVLGE